MLVVLKETTPENYIWIQVVKSSFLAKGFHLPVKEQKLLFVRGPPQTYTELHAVMICPAKRIFQA